MIGAMMVMAAVTFAPGKTEVVVAEKALNWLRLRMETENIPSCHGQNNFMIAQRFFKEHPEYSQTMKDGRSNKDVKQAAEYMRGQLCQSSGVWDEMYEDVASYFRGEDASARKMISRWDNSKYGWNTGFVGRKYVDCMPQDAMQECFCEKCQAAYDHSSKHYANELIWGNMAKLGWKLKKTGIPGTVTQMSYLPYGEVPKVELPDNILVVVAQTGPWQWRKEDVAQQVDMYRRWSEKTHRRVQTWTYPHKYGNHAIPGIPCIAPRTYGRYWKAASPYVTGGFLESEAERSILQCLNYYVFSRIAWDKDVDVEALLSDYHRRMFGAGAKAMAEVFEILEEKWIKEIAGNVVVGELGPVPKVPSRFEVWTRVYSPEVLKKLGGFFGAAEKAAKGDDGAMARILFMREQILKPLCEEAEKFMKAVSVETGLKVHAGPSKSVVAGGEFDSLDGWTEEVKGIGTKLSIDREVKVVGSGSLRIDCEKPGRHAAIKNIEGVLKPGRKCRISFFMKLKGVACPSGRGGVYAEVYDGHTWLFVPRNPYFGTVDWVYHEGEIEVSPQFEKPAEAYFHVLASGVTGTVWVDDVRIDVL